MNSSSLRCGLVSQAAACGFATSGSTSGQTKGQATSNGFGLPSSGSKLVSRAVLMRVAATSTTAAGDVPRRERQPRPGGQQRAARGDQGPAVVDDPAGLVAQQVGIDIADVERPGALDHQPLADVELAEGEVACAGIEDDVYPLRRHASAGPAGHPGVLAYLEADLNAAAVEDQVADRILLAAKLDRVADLLRPGLEPAGLVVQAVAAEEPLGHKARDPPIDRQAGTVEQGVAMQERQAQAHDHALRGRTGPFRAFSRPSPGVPSRGKRPRSRSR